VNAGKLNAISQYISTLYSPALVRLSPSIRLSLLKYFTNEIQEPLAKLYERYALDIVLTNPEDESSQWNFMVIEVNPFFELTGEGLFESEEGRKLLSGEAEMAEYPVMRVQEMRTVDGTEKQFLTARREVENEVAVSIF
jgi:hypothetical protein